MKAVCGDKVAFPTIFALFGPPEQQFWRFWADFAPCCEPPVHQEQVTECEERDEIRPVLGEPPVAGFHVGKLALEDPERMLNLDPHLFDDPVDLFVEIIRLTALGGLAHDTPESAAAFRETDASPRCHKGFPPPWGHSARTSFARNIRAASFQAASGEVRV